MFVSPIRDLSAARLADAEKANRESSARYLEMQFIVPRLQTFINSKWRPSGVDKTMGRKRSSSRDRVTDTTRVQAAADYDELTAKCNPASLTLSGFYAAPSDAHPDAVQCFACGVTMADWLAGDSPNDEHSKLCAECPFVRRRFKPVELSTVRDYVTFDRSVKVSAAKRYYESVMSEIRNLERADCDTLDRLVMALDDVDCASDSDTATSGAATAAQSEPEEDDVAQTVTAAKTKAKAKGNRGKTRKGRSRRK